MLLTHAVVQARANGARILLAHVIPPVVTEKKTAPAEVRMAGPGLCREAQDALEYAALQLQWQGILCDPFLLSGDTAEQIAALARAKNAGRILVGAYRDRGRSLAQRLMASMEIPVFVLGPQVTPFPSGDAHEGRILLPLSLRHERPAYLRLAARLARETGARVALLHVIEAEGMTDAERQREQMRTRMQLAALAATEKGLRYPIEIVVREGNVARAIVEEAMCPHRDYILLGSGSLRAEDGKQGIVQQVIERARCPVITVKPDVGRVIGLELSESRTGTLN
jgi:nucleotide-binding universal stress UspA family protein